MTLFLNGESLTIKEIKKLLNQDLQIDISEDAIERVKKSRQVVERIIENKETIYGITTGFGLFSDVLIDPSQYNELQVNPHSFPCMWYWETIFRRSGISNDGTTFKYIIERPLWSNFRISRSIEVLY